MATHDWRKPYFDKNGQVIKANSIHLIREIYEKGKPTGKMLEYWAPHGRGWNKGNEGAIDWLNLHCGWRLYDEYMAEQNHKQAAEKRETAKAAKQ